MSERIKPGDPAFPLTGERFPGLATGMTIRTWLAGQALAGLAGTGNTQSGETIASAAVIAADRVIAKLNEGANLMKTTPEQTKETS